MHIIIQTSRITIREFLPEEENTYLNHFNDTEVTLYLPKRSREERTNIFRTALEKYSADKITGIWGMFNATDGDFIGSCLLRPFDIGPGVLELGYSMEKRYWGSGIGTEMAIALVARAFFDESTLQVVAVTELANIGSQRVLEKAGLKRADNLLRDGIELAVFKTEKRDGERLTKF